jgi:hypothetical protein
MGARGETFFRFLAGWRSSNLALKIKQPRWRRRIKKERNLLKTKPLLVAIV